jgi:hypothetical protein
MSTVCDSFAVVGAAGSPARALQLARLVEGELIKCGWAGSGLSVAACRDIRAALDAKRPIIVAPRCRRLGLIRGVRREVGPARLTCRGSPRRSIRRAADRRSSKT